jgi:hypothetical protein
LVSEDMPVPRNSASSLSATSRGELSLLIRESLDELKAVTAGE